MMQYADNRMLPALKAMWKEAFGDEDGYIDLYFSHRYAPENTLVWTENGSPIAMMAMLPCRLCANAGELAARYIYGVATFVRHRGKGISTRLLEYAADIARQRGEALFLVPSGKGLYGFYQERGYRPFFYLDERTLPCTGEETAQGSLQPLLPAEYAALRDRRLGAPGFVRWGQDAVAYVLRENEYLGGRAAALTYHGERHAALLLKQNKTLLVRETTLPAEELLPAFGAYAKELGCEELRARLPAPDPAKAIPFGMLHRDVQIPEPFGYLNLALD